jgi:hypothetical protein
VKVRLLKDVPQGGGVKMSPARRATARPQLRPDGQWVEAPERVGAPAVSWSKGAVIEMSDASGRKYIDRGFAEEVE